MDGVDALQGVRATLALEPGEPLRGSLTPAGGVPAQRFTGWLELASALEDLRRHPTPRKPDSEREIDD